MQRDQQFYVYTLADPRDGKVFYVGKGKGARAKQHISVARSGYKDCNPAKVARIKEILGASLEPIIVLVEHYDNEADALEHERELIATTDGLTNILSGYGWSLTREEAERRASIRKSRILARDRATCMPLILRVDAYFTAIESSGLKLRAKCKPAQGVVDAIVQVTRELASRYREQANA